MEVDALDTLDFSHDQAHQVFHMHHETVGDQRDAQGLTGGNEHVAGEWGLCAITRGKGKGKGKNKDGSRRGQKYVSASGREIANKGEQRFPMVSNNGVVTEQQWQLAAVTRPLPSVDETCDAGNRVLFGTGGGVIQNLHTSEVTPFIRENGVY